MQKPLHLVKNAEYCFFSEGCLGDQRKEGFWFIYLFMLTKISPAVSSLPLVLLADLLSIKPQLVRKFPTRQAVLPSQNDASKNVRVNKLQLHPKQKIFLALFSASLLNSCSRRSTRCFAWDPEREASCCGARASVVAMLQLQILLMLQVDVERVSWLPRVPLGC